MENIDNKFKYPRTLHLPWSLGVTNDDKILKDISHLIGKEVVVTIKMDGENSTLMKDCIYARSIDSNNHPSRNWLKGLWSKICYDIPDNWRICGENLFATHSIHYTNLSTYFMVFNIWNENNKCLGVDDTIEYCKLFGLEYVPIIYRGIFDEEKIKSLVDKLDLNKDEGYVVRLAESFKYENFSKSYAKFVRANHVQTEKHWTNNKIIPNELK